MQSRRRSSSFPAPLRRAAGEPQRARGPRAVPLVPTIVSPRCAIPVCCAQTSKMFLLVLWVASGSRLGVVLPRGHLGYLYLPVGFLVSLELLGFPNKVLVSEKKPQQNVTQECLLPYYSSANPEASPTDITDPE